MSVGQRGVLLSVLMVFPGVCAYGATDNPAAVAFGGTGACCIPDGMGGSNCVTGLTAGDCHQANGVFHGVGSTCVPSPCMDPDGACCIHDACDGPTCVITTQADCVAQQGYYAGNFTTCIPETCQEPTGACCTYEFEGFQICTIETATDCNELSGLYHGDGTTCSPDPCVEPIVDCGVANCCERPPAFSDPAYAGFTGPVAVATKIDFLGPDLRVVVVDIQNKASAPVNTHWSAANLYSDPSWNQSNLGAVFGLALDRNGHIYVAASSAYSLNQTASGGPGGIYKIDAVSGAISNFTVTGAGGIGTNQIPNTLPALGNIAYDCKHNQFFVTNMEDGKIYRIDTSGVVQSVFDHGAPDSGAAGFPPLGERPWGVAVYDDRVYYGVWHEDDGRPSGVAANEVWSVGLGAGSLANDFLGAAQLEISVPPLSGTNYSNPVADISFTTKGCMLIAERPMFNDLEPNAHSGRVLEYMHNGVAWVPTPKVFSIGVSSGSFSGINATGGNDYDIDGHVWATGDALQYGPQSIYGLQCLPGAGGSVDNSVLIDLDLDLTMAEKSQIGDVELPCLPCTPPPRDMVAWWPMDEPFGFTAEEIVAGFDAAHVNGVAPIQGKVSRALRFDGVNDSATVPDHGALDFGAVTAMPGSGDFSIDAWVRTCVETGLQPMVDKRAVSPVTGYAFYIQNGALALQLADGSATDFVSASSLADGDWHHVAVTVDRDNITGITFYVDGQSTGGPFDPTSHSGSLANSAPLRIGESHAIPSVTRLGGAIDELEIFDRVLTPAEVASLYGAQNAGKCKDKCHVPWGKPFCQGQSTRNISPSICNHTASDHTYNWSLVTVPGSGGAPGVGCNVNGPPSFSPNAGVVTVPAGQCVSIPVTMTRPAGFVGTAPLTGCFDFLAANLESGHSFSCRGSVQQSDKYCPVILNPGPILETPVNTPIPLVFEIENVSGPGDILEFSVVSVFDNASGENSDTVSLDGLPPGEPIVRTVKIPPGEIEQAEVSVNVLKHDEFSFHDLLVMLDQDGDGNSEVVESVAVRSLFVDGACCLGVGNCIGDETPDSCADQQGTFMGSDVTCAEVECLPADIPAVSEWGIIVMALCLITTGTVLYRRCPTLLDPGRSG